MKRRIYLRIAKHRTGFMVKADKLPIQEPLRANNNSEYRPTVLIALDLEIPDKEFDVARILLEAKIKETIPVVEIEQVEIKEENAKKDLSDFAEEYIERGKKKFGRTPTYGEIEEIIAEEQEKRS